MRLAKLRIDHLIGGRVHTHCGVDSSVFPVVVAVVVRVVAAVVVSSHSGFITGRVNISLSQTGGPKISP